MSSSERFFSGLRRLLKPRNSSSPQPELPPVSYGVTEREAELILGRSLDLFEKILKLPSFNDEKAGARMVGSLVAYRSTQIGLYNAGKYQEHDVRRGSEGFPYYLVNRSNQPLDAGRRIALIEFDRDNHEIIPNSEKT